MSSRIFLKKKEEKLNDIDLVISGSKSMSQRALIINFLGNFLVDINNLSNSNDTFTLNKILKDIPEKNQINVGKGGTTLRFLLPILSMQKTFFYVQGDESLKKRPISDLIDALKFLGVRFDFINNHNELPFKLFGCELNTKLINISSKKTSQFISSLLLVGPYIKGGLELKIKDKIVSRSYINMTINMMKKCGVDVFWKKNKIIINQGVYSKPFVNLESDWTSVAYLYQLVALSNKTNIKISSFVYPSIQKDSDLVLFFNFLGVKTSFIGDSINLKKIENQKLPYYLEWDVLNTPDLMPSYMVSCFSLGIDLKLTGIDSLKYKESNRIQTIKIGLEKFNAKIKLTNNTLILDSSNPIFREQVIDTFHDHRIALAFSSLVLKTNQLTISNPNVIDKSYPDFWAHLKKIGIQVVFKK